MAPNEFIAQCVTELNSLNDTHAKTWGLGKADNWFVNQEKRVIEFQFADRVASAPVQIIGTYNRQDGTFSWGWGHPSVLPLLQDHAKVAKAWGIENKVEPFASLNVKCSEDDCWGFTAVAVRLAGAKGAFRGLLGPAAIFMTFGEVTITKKVPENPDPS